MLAFPPVFTPSHQNAEVLVATNTSAYIIGAVLEQVTKKELDQSPIPLRQATQEIVSFQNTNASSLQSLTYCYIGPYIYKVVHFLYLSVTTL